MHSGNLFDAAAGTVRGKTGGLFVLLIVANIAVWACRYDSLATPGTPTG